MISEDLLKILACPETRQELSVAPSETVEKLNAMIRSRELRLASGEPLSAEIDGALIRADRRVAYAVRDEIPVLLIEQAFELPEGV